MRDTFNYPAFAKAAIIASGERGIIPRGLVRKAIEKGAKKSASEMERIFNETCSRQANGKTIIRFREKGVKGYQYKYVPLPEAKEIEPIKEEAQGELF